MKLDELKPNGVCGDCGKEGRLYLTTLQPYCDCQNSFIDDDGACYWCNQECPTEWVCENCARDQEVMNEQLKQEGGENEIK